MFRLPGCCRCYVVIFQALCYHKFGFKHIFNIQGVRTQMKKIPVQDAVGIAICHDMTQITGETKGPRFKRGHIITPEDVDVLLDMGKSHIFIWEESEGLVHEEDAALALTKAALGPNTEYTPPSEGKITVKSTVHGLFKINRAGLRNMNEVEKVALAFLPGNTPVVPGQKIAGIRIIPLLMEQKELDRALEAGKNAWPVLSVLPFRHLNVGLIITGGEVYTGRVQDRFEPVMREKQSSYDADIIGVTFCPDDLTPISDAISHYLSEKADLIILTGGMSVDSDDLTPTAIRQSGADIISYGIPAQPGNMLMLAYHGNTALLGVPGAAMHHKTTTFDVLLPRIFAGDRITRKELASMGEGGLCSFCDTCHYPICYFCRG